MEQERIAREAEEKDKAEKAKKIKEQFGDQNNQWEKDKMEMQNLALQEKKPAVGDTAAQGKAAAPAGQAAPEAGAPAAGGAAGGKPPNLDAKGGSKA